MSEQNFPLGAGGVGVAEPEPVAEETPTRGSRGVLLAVLGLAVAVVAGLAAYFLLFSGGSEDVAAGPVTPSGPSASAPPASAAPSASAPAPAVVPPTFDENVGTDPFEPQVVAPAPAPSGGAATGGAPGSTGTTGGTTVQLQLLSVADDSSTLDAQVDGKPYNDLAVGAAFATYFKVYGIFDGRCAGFLFGDQTVALCEGDSTSLSR